eukprot:scaffold8370_cov105-Cylindrotheca_fusiformis.AAC.2
MVERCLDWIKNKGPNYDQGFLEMYWSSSAERGGTKEYGAAQMRIVANTHWNVNFYVATNHSA